jgi:uncharacterized protein YciW
MGQSVGHGDVLETIMGVAPDSELARLRAQRPDIVRHTQGSYDVLLFPSEPGGLTPAMRALVAARVAELSGHPVLAAHYRGLLAERGEPPAGALRDTILAHAERVTVAPASATSAHIEALLAAGLSATDIVALSQLVAFVSYQVRAAIGLALLAQEKAA